MVKKSFIEEAMELYGEQRYFTDKEREIYKRVTEAQSTPLRYDPYTDSFIPTGKVKEMFLSNTTRECKND